MTSAAQKEFAMNRFRTLALIALSAFAFSACLIEEDHHGRGGRYQPGSGAPFCRSDSECYPGTFCRADGFCERLPDGGNGVTGSGGSSGASGGVGGYPGAEAGITGGAAGGPAGGFDAGTSSGTGGAGGASGGPSCSTNADC